MGGLRANADGGKREEKRPYHLPLLDIHCLSFSLLYFCVCVRALCGIKGVRHRNLLTLKVWVKTINDFRNVRLECWFFCIKHQPWGYPLFKDVSMRIRLTVRAHLTTGGIDIVEMMTYSEWELSNSFKYWVVVSVYHHQTGWDRHCNAKLQWSSVHKVSSF